MIEYIISTNVELNIETYYNMYDYTGSVKVYNVFCPFT